MKWLLILSLFLGFEVNAQQPDSVYKLTSTPTYDQNGNFYQVVKDYDHVPTAADSADFLIESRNSILEMIDINLRADSMGRANYQQPKRNRSSSKKTSRKKRS